MPKNIYIVGAQCTGKTTLVTALQEHFKSQKENMREPRIITEVARGVLKEHHFTASDIRSSKIKALQLQRLIIEAQFETERASGDDPFISDRSGFDPIVYTRKYVSESAAEALMKLEIWQELKTRMTNSLIVVCEAGADWLKDDGVRLMPDDKADWIALHELFCKTLDESHMDCVVLPHTVGGHQERVEFVLSRWRV